MKRNNFKVIIAITDSGGGHRASANALYSEFKRLHLPWQIKIVNIVKDVWKEGWGEAIYNSLILKMRLRKFQWLFYVPIIQKVIDIKSRTLLKKLKRYWEFEEPNLVISMMPLANKLLQQSLEKYNPNIDFYTIITDFVDNPPKYWIEDLNQEIFCPTFESYEQSVKMGIPKEKIHLLSGVIIHPKFYKSNKDSIASLSSFFDKNKKTALLLFGAQGSSDIITWLNTLDKFYKELQIILVCGHNKKLMDRLNKMNTRINKLVVGFTNHINVYMDCSDFFIGKPGPGCIAEAVQKRLPIITMLDNNTLEHEQFNSLWVKENNIGIVVSNQHEIEKSIITMLDTNQYNLFVENLLKIKNNSIFEVSNHFIDKYYKGSDRIERAKVLIDSLD
ncbi:MGDG synthase family glycosyltransferase [Spirochaeta cellobiosiphila]|uniref:MGDG synthase family glycosyltransferase n=1 Tax=Spirochaeta cellobiosiphila TaxID=504483 RepID=UPI0004002865|nr:glycosyltransferase [Spirochaeta cellobiosiphila]